jgi:hypothetical protein
MIHLFIVAPDFLLLPRSWRADESCKNSSHEWAPHVPSVEVGKGLSRIQFLMRTAQMIVAKHDPWSNDKIKVEN